MRVKRMNTIPDPSTPALAIEALFALNPQTMT